MTANATVNPQQTKLLQEYKLDRPLTSCHWDPQSRFVFCGAEDFLIHRIDPVSGEKITLAAHDSWIRAFGSSSDGETLYSGGYDGRLVFWPASAAKPEPLRILEAHQGWVRAIAASPDGKHVATCGNDRLVKVWDAATGTLVREFSGHAHHVYNLIYSQDSRQLFSCDLKGIVNAWALDPDGFWVGVSGGGGGGWLYFWKGDSADEFFRLQLKNDGRGMSLSPDGKQVAVAHVDNHLRTYSLV